MRKIKYIVVHCTATSSLATRDSIEAGWRAIGWKSPGYHVLIEANGLAHQLADYDETTNGVKGHNHHSIHVAYIGGLRDGKGFDTRTSAQREALKHILCQLKVMYPGAEQLGHCDLSPDLDGDGIIEPHEWVKLCPCFNVKKEL